MALLLNIDTSLENASVCLSMDKAVLAFAENKNQKDHAAWLHHAIADLFTQTGTSINKVQAVAVSIGPGSYTGLRVGLSAAKGLCYALNIPLITVGTLRLLAFAVKEEAKGLICPLIDARRMEVFTAVYDKELKQVLSPCNMVVDEHSFSELLAEQEILFCGNGRKKMESLLSAPNARFSDTEMTAIHLAAMALECYKEKQFSDLAYTEPLYLKEFYTAPRKIS